MTPVEFDERLQELLDARSDPLADPECVAFLDAHPERLDGLARLLQRCATLAVVSPRHVRRRRPMVWLVAAAGIAPAFEVAASSGSPAPAAPPPGGRVLAASLQPIRPTLQPTATIRAYSVLLAGPTARLETFTQWSAR
jgi:hypothetical protein